MPLDAVVLDFDGVIADSEPLHFGALRDVLAGEGVTLSESDYYARYLGFDDVGAFNTIAADRGLRWTPAVIAAMMAKKAVRLEALERDVSVLFPGAADAIRRLSAAGPLAIASGALRAEILRVLERESLTRHFAVIVAAEDTAASKPAPDPYLKAVSLLAAAFGTEIVAARCVAVEDSRWGVLSAQAAGLRAVAVTHTYAASDLAIADKVITSLDTLSWEFLEPLVANSRPRV